VNVDVTEISRAVEEEQEASSGEETLLVVLKEKFE
jgi:hypothetical protein